MIQLSKLSINKGFSQSQAKIIDKFLSAGAFIFITIALFIVATTPPATGYELTIYDAYPSYFWFFIAASSACGIGIFAYQAFAKEKSNWWLSGLCIVVFSNSIFLGLPFLHGYVFYPKGDALTHIGMMKDIIATGHIGKGNFYPVAHILGVSLLDVTGLSRGAVTNLLFIFWSIIYLLGMCLLATVIADCWGQALLITAFACPLVFSIMHTLIHPSILSLFMIPLLLYFYHRRQKAPSGQIATALALLLPAFLITFTHPVTCLFVIIVLLTFNLVGSVYQRIVERKETALERGTVIPGGYTVSLIMSAVFFLWYFGYAAIQEDIKSVYNFLVYGGRMSLFESQTSTLAMAGITTSQTIELFIYRYGAILIYLIISVITVAMVLRTSLSRKAQPEPMSFTYAIQFIVALATSIFSLWGYTGEYNPLRISRFFLMMTPIVSGLVIYEFVCRDYQQRVNLHRLEPKGKAFVGVITVLILAVSVLSILNVYGSPRTVYPNLQVSRMELAGSKWFSNHQDRNIVTTAITGGEFLRRFEDFNFGRETCLFPNKARIMDPEPVPSHFGYDKNDSITETFDFQDRYLLTYEAGRINVMLIPENVRHKAHQYTGEDFARLRADPAVAQIYANGEFEVWRVYGKVI